MTIVGQAASQSAAPCTTPTFNIEVPTISSGPPPNGQTNASTRNRLFHLNIESGGDTGVHGVYRPEEPASTQDGIPEFVDAIFRPSTAGYSHKLMVKCKCLHDLVGLWIKAKLVQLWSYL